MTSTLIMWHLTRFWTNLTLVDFNLYCPCKLQHQLNKISWMKYLTTWIDAPDTIFWALQLGQIMEKVTHSNNSVYSFLHWIMKLIKIKNFWILCELLFWNVFGSSRNMKWWYQNGSFKGIYLMELLKYNDTRAFNFTFDVLLTSNKHIYFYIDTKVTNKLIKERRIPSWHVICQFKIFFKWYSVCLGMIVCDNFAWLCLFRTFTSKIYV